MLPKAAFQDNSVQVPDILLNILTTLNLTAAIWTDNTTFSRSVYEKLIFEAPVLPFNSATDMRELPRSVIVLVMGKSTSIDLTPEFYPVPKRRVLFVTDSFDINDLPVIYTQRLNSYWRTRFAWLNIFPEKVKIWTISNQPDELLIEIETEEVVNIFQDVRLSSIPDFQGMELLALVANSTVYSYIARGKNQSNYVDGVHAVIFDEACKLMNLKPKYIMPEPGETYGSFENGTFTSGMQRDVMEMKVDVLIGGTYFKPGAMGLIDMSNTWGFTCVRYLVPRPPTLHSVRYVMINAFTLTTWLMTMATILLVAGMSTIIAKNSSNTSLKSYFNFIDSFLMIIFHLLQMRYPSRSQYIGCLFPLLLSWGCLGFLLTTAYNSELAASFTIPRYANKIQTEEEFIREGYTWGKAKGNDSWWLMFNMENPVTRTWANEHRMDEEEGDRAKKLRNGEKYILVGLTMGKIFFYHDNDKPPDELTSSYEVSDQCITEMYNGLMFPPGSPYLQGLNLIRSRMLAGGILQKLEHDLMMGRPFIMDQIPKGVFTRSQDIRELVSYKQISMRAIYEIFYILLGGYITSAVVFCLEIVEDRYYRRGQKVSNTELIKSESYTHKSYQKRYYIFHLKPTTKHNILNTKLK